MADVERLSLAVKAIEGWQRNRMTTFTPANILQDFGDEILDALRLAARPADDGVREAERLKGTLRYILAQAKAAHAGVLQVIIANAEFALDDDQRRALSTKPKTPPSPSGKGET